MGEIASCQEIRRETSSTPSLVHVDTVSFWPFFGFPFCQQCDVLVISFY